MSFCPECKAEYREGFTVCSDCRVDLVAELPPEPETEYIEYVEFLRTMNPFDIALIKSLLEDQDIAFFFQGEQFAHLVSMGNPIRLMVEKDKVDEVKELLKDLTISYGVSTSEEGEEE